MYKFSQRGLSAFLYTVAHDMESGLGVGMPFKANSSPWLALIEAELAENDKFTTSDGSSFEIELADADENRALKIARLIRNSFQLQWLYFRQRLKIRRNTLQLRKVWRKNTVQMWAIKYRLRIIARQMQMLPTPERLLFWMFTL